MFDTFAVPFCVVAGSQIG